ncbi:AAA family ATPase [Thiothrix nivea]|uniref:ORC1/DEAH AAA+ ATPase domain-containing protein n=1 Tax=Thiothrix nivea (strain ATCC 35100 / DSM 5205 / JP2) TaxID=870187 RepID=A0A656HB87_THINJ|nr:AAA family ATPase [Thiothrix nivea]EIJ33563.1 hypothetical protein Thini_0938 [Thiothrix nivea DSM 5205]
MIYILICNDKQNLFYILADTLLLQKLHFNHIQMVQKGKLGALITTLPVDKLVDEDIRALIAAKKFFVLHAPRQTGKTTTLLAMMDVLNQSGEYTALYMGVESAQSARNDVAAGMKAILGSLVYGAEARLQEYRLKPWRDELWPELGEHATLRELLSRWARESAKPIVLMIDEVDALVGDTLISLLRQLREGYIGRPGVPFVQSVILCGVRDVRDYRIHTAHHEIITGGSAFNVKAKSLVMGSFTRTEIETLYAQHTTETGQAFAPEIFPELWEDTRGQPWLVNAFGHELTWEDKAARDRSTPITLECYRAARECLIQSRTTHLSQLSDKLQEARVHGVISALLAGEVTPDTLAMDDVEYVADLGLIGVRPQLHIANRIYRRCSLFFPF